MAHLPSDSVSSRWRVSVTDGSHTFHCANGWGEFTLLHFMDDLPDEVALPEHFTLNRLYPNPFNRELTLESSLPHAGRLETRLFDITGRLVLRKNTDAKQPGVQLMTVSFGEGAGRGVASGVYFIQTRAIYPRGGSDTVLSKTIFLK